MRLIQMEPNKPQCLLYCAAMLLEVAPDVLANEIGHDGMGLQWTNLARPRCYRSHHIQEILDCFVARGYGLMLVESNPHQAPTKGVQPLKTFNNPEERFYNHIHGKEAIMIGTYLGSIHMHAWAWDGETCYDPNGVLLNLANYDTYEAWVKTSL